MKDRIRQIMESQNLTQQNFADMLALSPASLSSIFNDRTKPTMNHVEAIHKRFPNISLHWLMFGEGSMYTKKPAAPDYSSTPSASGEQTLLFGDDALEPAERSSRPDFPAQNIFSNSDNVQSQKIQNIKIIDKPQRKISEIRIFFDDQTWETFVAKKQ